MTASITQTITEDLRTRILANRPLPAPLALTPLAEYYRVSITPIRLAINALLEEGVLIKQPNGRLQINATRVSLSEGSQMPPIVVSATDQETDWEARLVEEILRRSLRGRDDYLREETMAQRYAVGRTVLRQIFNRLAGKGLLEHVPRCGWKVRTFDEADMHAYLTAREALELTALDLAHPYLVKADLEKLLQGNASEAAGTPARLNNELHHYLIEKSGNHYIRDFFDRYGLYYTFLFDYAAPEAHVTSEMAEQHRRILQALLQEDWSQARRALAQHIRAQKPIVARLMEILSKSYTEGTTIRSLRSKA